VKKRIYLFINGILSWPGDSHGWATRAVTFFNVRTPHKGQADLYFCTAIGRAWHQGRRIQSFVDLLRWYVDDGWEIVVAAHSNGCDIALHGLALAQFPKVQALHLFSGACSADFHRNGLNYALESGQLGSCAVYCGGQDKALKFASHAGRWLGYGTLGLTGPENMLPGVSGLVRVVKVPDFGHSDWWADENFVSSMDFILASPHLLSGSGSV
jgi:hypothetical protein